MAEPLSAFAEDRAYLDAVTLIAHFNVLHPLSGACTAFLTRATDPGHPVELATASLTFDEVAMVLLQELVARPPARVTRNRTQYLGRHPTAVKELTAVLSPSLGGLMSIVSVEPVNASDVGAMLQAMQSYGMLPRDAIHLAVARRLGITAIVSDDDVFDQIPGIRLYKP